MPNATLPAQTPPDNCPACGTPFKGKFCHHCGEKSVTAKDFAAGKYARLLVEHFSHLDFKLLRTLKLLITQPGFLSAAYVSGLHKMYLKPLQLFLAVNLVFFFLFGGNDVFAPKVKFTYHSNMRDWSGQGVKQMTDDYAQRENISTEAAIIEIDRHIGDYTKGLLYAFVPLLGLVFYALFFRQNPYFLCHLIFATHWFAFMLIFIMATGLVLAGIFRLHGLAILTTLLALLIPHHMIAIRRFYGQSWWILAVKTAIFMSVFSVLFFLYREFILFLTFRLI